MCFYFNDHVDYAVERLTMFGFLACVDHLNNFHILKTFIEISINNDMKI